MKPKHTIKIIFSLKKFISLYIKNSTRIMYHDCETLKFNTNAIAPKFYNSREYSVCFGFLADDDTIYVIVVDSYFTFLNYIKTIDRFFSITLKAHNANGFDNHFILRTLVQKFRYIETPKQQPKFTEKLYTYIDNIKYEDDKNYVFTSRIKSRAKVELTFTIGEIDITTMDTYPTTNESLAMVCKRLEKTPEILDPKYLKLDGYNYTEYDTTDKEVSDIVVKNIFNNLSGFNFRYQINDVIAMIAYYENYETFFPKFDRKKPSIASNTLNYFTKNIPETRKILTMPTMNYSDYEYKKDISMFQHFNKSYSAGCNFYNDNFLGCVVEGDLISLDLNSSFIRPIYDSYLPLKPSNFFPSKKFTIKELKNLSEKTFFIANIKISDFNNIFIYPQISLLIAKIFTKYFKSNIENDNVVLTSVNLKIMSLFLSEISDYVEVELTDVIYFKTEIFKGAELIAENYRFKQQGKNKKILDMSNVLDIKETNEINYNVVDENQYAISKIINNSLYGAPALRNFFNVFVKDETGKFLNFNKGLENAERNILFSLAVTAYSFFNLLHPFSTIKNKSFIDDYLFYGDTDSAYIDKRLLPMMKITLHPNNLGSWDIEHDNITKIFVSNHKRYAYELSSGERIIKSGGIRAKAFENGKNLSFEEFTYNFMGDGCEVTNTNSILTENGVPVIYDYQTEIRTGFLYDIGLDEKTQVIKERYINDILKKGEDFTNAIYYDTPQGVITQRDIAEFAEPTKKNYTLNMLDYLMDGIEI